LIGSDIFRNSFISPSDACDKNKSYIYTSFPQYTPLDDYGKTAYDSSGISLDLPTSTAYILINSSL